jgi:hypothetical protein
MKNFITVFKLAWLSMLLYPFAALASWIVGTLGSWLISPFLAAWSVLTKNPTPGGLWVYFYTHDNTLDGGWDDDVDGYADPATLSAWGLFKQRLRWICRNPGYGLNAFLLGFKDTANVKIVFEDGIPWPEDSYWYVIQSDKGWKFFGYRGKKAWVGWNYLNYGGYHQVKTRPWRFR